jgi:hypothetical protein
LQAWRDLGKVAIVALILGVCFAMLVSAIGPRSPWLGLLLMFYFLGLTKVAEPLFRLRMPRSLRAIKHGQAGDGIYRRLGVRAFGSLLRDTPLRHLNDSVYLAHGERSLAALAIQAESAEAAHFWAAVLFAPYIAYVWSRGLIAEAIFFVVVQVVFNVYPILHLRLLRARLDRVNRTTSARRARKAQRNGDA